MNRLCLVPIIGFFILFTSTCFAQQHASETSIKQSVYRDGVTCVNGEIIRIKNGKTQPLTETITMPEGTTVTPDGMVKSPDGKSRKLKEGMAVNEQGRIVILKDDMFLPREIRNSTRGHNQETVIIESPDTVIIKKR